MIALIVVIALVVIVLLYGVSVYNKLVKFRNLVQEAWSSIDVMLKKRYDLIPNLVETVKGYATHERETLDSVTQARTMAKMPVLYRRKKLLRKILIRL
jgi:LemA protein